MIIPYIHLDYIQGPDKKVIAKLIFRINSYFTSFVWKQMEFKNWVEYIWACAIKHNFSKQAGKLFIHTYHYQIHNLHTNSLSLFSDFEENIHYREDKKMIYFLQSMQSIFKKLYLFILVC